MTRQDLQELEDNIMELVVTRRKLGGFDTNAEAVLTLSEALFMVIRHMRERAPRQKEKD